MGRAATTSRLLQTGNRYWLAGSGFVLIFFGLAQYARLDGAHHILDSYGITSPWSSIRAAPSWLQYQNWTFPDEVLENFHERNLKAEFIKARLGCQHWTPEKALQVDDDRFDECWRHKPYLQLHNYFKVEVHPFEYM